MVIESSEMNSPVIDEMLENLKDNLPLRLSDALVKAYGAVIDMNHASFFV